MFLINLDYLYSLKYESLQLIISIVTTPTLYLLYSAGSSIAAYFDHIQRGGVGWGLSVYYATGFMFPCFFLALSLVNLFKVPPAVATLIGFLGFFSSAPYCWETNLQVVVGFTLIVTSIFNSVR